ncbi:MAG: 50S ribosome-binding GTPase [Planctomycetaceae bacterium]|jgi:small GTP-binding protein|nr:50S ribosome-binding GTPase [Planctomycetaceae bacterium]
MCEVRLVRLTAVGRGGVATLLLTGAGALDKFLLRFVSVADLNKLSYSPNRPYFGKIYLNDMNQYEEVITRIIDSDNVEIHCHGGEMIFSALAKTFANDGVLRQDYFDPQNCFDANVLNGDCDFNVTDAQRELSLRLLPFAATERVAQILLDQYHGALERELLEISGLVERIDRIRRNVENVENVDNVENIDRVDKVDSVNSVGKVVGVCDNDSDFDVDDVEMERLQFQLCKRCERLESNRRLGQHLIEPFRVVLLGESNVGKSSIFNSIVGYGRAITSSAPGTTRDVVVAQTAIDGFPVAIYDTAGIRNSNIDKIEQEGIRRSIEQINNADLVIRVIDLTTNLNTNTNTNTNANMIGELLIGNNVTKNMLICYNKADLVSELPDGICVSAKTGYGISELIERIAKLLAPNPPQPFEAVPLGNWKLY